MNSTVKEGLDIRKVYECYQMRQKDDVEYQHLLHRAKTCTLTIRLLNTGIDSTMLDRPHHCFCDNGL